MKNLFAIFLLLSCVTTKPVAQEYITTPIAQEFFLDGYIITPPDLHRGDSALFTGIAMASQGCDFPLTLVKQILRDDGLIRRHPQDPKPHDPSSRDMVIGAMLGMVSRFNRCPNDRLLIKEAWRHHLAYVKDGKLYPGAKVDKSLTPALTWLWLGVGDYFGVTKSPKNPTIFRANLISTAAVIREQRAACYPIHLAYLQIVIAEMIGRPIDSATKLGFCTATRGTDLPLVDDYCEREVKWREGFNYQSQRCAWENPDGPGHELDRPFLDALKSGYTKGKAYQY